MAKLTAATYGDSLFDVAVELDKVDALFEEAKAVADVFETNKEFTDFLNHPKIDKDTKIKVTEQSLENFVSKEMVGFIVTIITKGRVNDIPDIFRYFIGKVKEYKKIGIAYVTTPMELNEAMKAKVEKKLLDTTEYVSFEMHYSVDASLIGGMVIRIGNRIVDSSIKTRLAELSRELYKVDIV